MEVYLIRHTTPNIEKGICYGFSDIPLAHTFKDEWDLIKLKLPDQVDQIFSSPLSRCKSLSSKLATHFNIAVQEDSRLKEMNFGAWELKRWEDIDQKILKRWMDNYRTEKCPGGESYEDVIKRVTDFIEEYLTKETQRVIIVTHGGVIKSFDSVLNQRDGIALTISYGEILKYTI